MIEVGILTISDSSHQGTREDLSGPAVAALCQEQGWHVAQCVVLPDEQQAIARALVTMCASLDLVLTTGGTGVSARDVTPEATRAVIEKELPGLGELMRAEGLKFTRRAVLSRAVAGTRDGTLIVNLPGSPKGARQSLGAILDLVPHIVELLRGNTTHEDQKPS
jgi:molybdenum cofactor synthesis domain-containing protein